MNGKIAGVTGAFLHVADVEERAVISIIVPEMMYFLAFCIVGGRPGEFAGLAYLAGGPVLIVNKGFIA
ncbi:MAG: hypothetical protein LBD64_04935 [Odoribacteraceae bacterium]|jgi:hypothetical protein|nr:hypothetical protein [Odoribacteraceae bacterium]